MDALQEIVAKVDEYVGSLIDVADMPAEDREALKAHLLEAQKILLRNGQVRLTEFVSAVTKALLDRF